jgi:hypothetical protein
LAIATIHPYTDDTRILGAFILGKDFWLGRPLVVAGQEEGETITAGKRPKQSTPTPKDKRCVSTTYPTIPTAVKQHKKKSKWKTADSQRQRENKCKEDGQALA